MHLENERRVRTLKEVRSDLSQFTHVDLRIAAGEEVEIRINSVGAVTALVGEDGLGLKPNEFEYIPLPGRPLLDVMREAVHHLGNSRDHSIFNGSVLAQRMRESLTVHEQPTAPTSPAASAMSEERARGIVGHMFEWHLFDQGVNPELPELMTYTLREMLEAQDIVRVLNERESAPREPGDVRKRSIQVVCDDRLVAAMYVAMKYPGDRGRKVDTIATHGNSTLICLDRRDLPNNDEEE